MNLLAGWWQRFRNRFRPDTITASEFMKKLDSDEQYQKMKMARDRELREFEEAMALDEAELVLELTEGGISAKSVWDLVNGPNDYHFATPILLRHLSHPHHPRIIQGIVRALTIPELGTNERVWQEITAIYQSTPPG